MTFLGFSPTQWLMIAILALVGLGAWYIRGEVCDATIYKTRVTDLENENKRLKDAYTAIKTTLDQQTAVLSRDEERRKQAEDRATTLEGRVNELEGKTTDAVCFRDGAADGVRNLWGNPKSTRRSVPKTPPTLGGVKGLRQPSKARPAPQGNR